MMVYLIRMKVDLTGIRFGKLVALKSVGHNKHGQALWKCKCDCGRSRVSSLSHLRTGFNKSCGCLQKPHGMSETPFFNVWSGMLKRCRLKSRADWKNYGGRGIKVAVEWEDFLTFKKDMFDSFKRHKKKFSSTLLDRVDNDKGYSKENCRWVTSKESSLNRRATHWIVYGGKKKSMTEWALLIGIKPTTLLDRLKGGWSKKRALTTPKLRD